MKYLYKGMGMPGWGDVSGSVLLGWHEKVCLKLASHINFLTINLQLTEHYMTDRRKNCMTP
ncbi:hypothetical protein C8R48DRAFT_694143 [Suillus tomentosus]|nr:hypothetical protein C8R48DRAFT_694143 [Suillus tomentosus]